MKVEYLPDGTPDCPLIRIYGDERENLLRLQQAFDQLASGSVQKIAIERLQGFESIGDCHVRALLSQRDVGITTKAPMNFTIELTAERWRDLSDMTAELVEVGEGTFHQWLDKTSDISVLLTTS